MTVSSLLAVSEKLWFEPLVWMDYRLALLLSLIMPLVLLIWAFVQKNDTIQHLLSIYWRVASLLAITIYMMIGALPVGFIASLFARVLILISLWFWIDLNEDLEHQSEMPLRWTFKSWRWAMTVYNLVGALAQIPFLTCALSKQALETRFCQVWLDPPLLYKEYFHHNTDARVLGVLGFLGLLAYVSYLSYFVLVKLAKHGRSALDY